MSSKRFSSQDEGSKKKVIVIIILIVIISIILFFMTRSILQIINYSKTGKTTPSKIYYSPDKTINVILDKDLNKAYKFKQYTPLNDYLIELRSENNIDLFIAKKEKLEDKDLNQVVELDCNDYSSQFTNVSNVSSIQEFHTDLSKNAYTYSLQYLEKQSRTPFYLQVAWLEFNDCYYVIDIEMPLNILQDTPEEGSRILTTLLSSITIINS